ncbi:AI-2E family transporter [Maribellus comscasis]|uniref:AI-2E family transporter n=2 Tax=Maribellus comscasis TaxID=2681766 RepID=A0A6I6JQM6_9BACT|nr:AI-2E family transporter [Maribellus comscasis]
MPGTILSLFQIKFQHMENQRLIRFTLVLFIITILLAGIITAKSILIPLAISVFFSYLFYPVSWKIEKLGIHRAIAILFVILVAILIIGSVALFLSAKLSNMTIDLAELKENFETKADSLKLILENKLGMNAGAMDHYVDRFSNNFFSSWETQLGNLFAATTTTIFQIAILPVFTFFLLFYRTKSAHFIFRVVGRKKREKTLHILREVSTVTTRYLGGLFIVVAILAILNSTGLYIIGVKHALIFGILAALLNLIPYAGTFLGFLIPFSYVLFTVPDPFSTLLKVAVLFIVVQFTENNLLTPNIVGNSIKINPLAIILSLLVANMIWGIAGMLIVVPTLAILKVIMRNIDELKPYAFLISDRGVDKYRVSFKKLWKRKK